jgi:hypothetical protein
MHLLGPRTRTRTLGAGTFRCPREAGNRRYAYIAVQRWLSLATMPVVRLEEVGRFVECQSCASTYDAGVLAQPCDAAVEDVLTRALRRAATTLLTATETLSADDRREAVIVLQRYANVPYSSADLRRDLAQNDQDHLDVELRELGITLNDSGREAILDAGLQLACPQGTPDRSRIQALTRVAELLAIPEDRVRVAMDRRLGGILLAG